MAILSSRALMGRTPTAGEVLSNGVLLDLIRDPDTGQVGILVWTDKVKKVGSPITIGRKHYIPPNVDPTVLAALQLPRNFLPAAPPTGELFDDVCRQFAEFTGLAEGPLRQVAYFIFATWMADRIPDAPFLWVAALSAADGSEFMQLLALFCRRSLLLSADSSSGLWTLPMYLRPTLLLDGAELTTPLQRFLHASNNKGIHLVKRGQTLDLYCPKAICSLDALSDPALASCALRINLPSRHVRLPTLTEEMSKSIADTFQAKFLAYRLAHFQQVTRPDVDLQGLTPATQGLAESLAACIFGDAKLQSEVVSLLRDQDRVIVEERSTGLESVILEALLHCCHVGNRSSVRVSELAEATNTILSLKGYGARVSPESVGWKLRYLRFRTEFIGSGGKSLWLLDDVRRRIHSQAREYRVPLDPQGAQQECPLCSNSMGEGSFTSGKDGTNSEDLSQVV
jgi:hypothetical protein